MYRDVPVIDETTDDSEIDLSLERRTLCDQLENVDDDDFEEEDAMQVRADCSVPSFAKNFDEKRPVVGTIGATGFKGDLFLVAMDELSTW